ncbi:unnamed protein product [Trichobilharzia szidati]|nr:unnamed protein product [Trichobilharzia szidati]
MASASKSTCLIVTAFFLCTCESANINLRKNETTEVDKMLNDDGFSDYEPFKEDRLKVENIIKNYDDAMQINKKNISQYQSDIYEQVKLVKQVIKDERNFRRFMKCQENYTSVHSLLNTYKGM